MLKMQGSKVRMCCEELIQREADLLCKPCAITARSTFELAAA
jgi:hypothetical protein